MKIRKPELLKMIRESIRQESTSVAFEQKQVAHYSLVCLYNTPFLKEHKKIKTKKQLLEFVGPFKKLGVKDLQRGAQQRDAKTLMGVVKDVEKARRALGSVSLNDVASVKKALNNYVGQLYDLFELQKGADLDKDTKAQLTKPFAVAALTLQNLSQTLNDAANKLFQMVPRKTKVYSKGKEMADIESAQKSFMMGPGQRLAQMGKDIWGMGSGGMGSGRPAKS